MSFRIHPIESSLGRVPCSSILARGVGDFNICSEPIELAEAVKRKPTFFSTKADFTHLEANNIQRNHIGSTDANTGFATQPRYLVENIPQDRISA